MENLIEKITKKQADIEKRKKLLIKAETELQQAKTAQEQNIKTEWGIWYYEDNVKSNKKKLKELEKQLENLQNLKAKEDAKKAVKRIDAIEQLLELWKQKARDYAKGIEETKNHLYKLYDDYKEELKKTSKTPWWVDDDEKAKQLWEHYENFKKRNKGWIDILNIEKFLDREVEIRRQNLISTVEKKAGNIIDATNLRFGVDDGINGIIIGDKAKVEVYTIYAGGYNIQCLHYRVLVKPLKS